MTSNAYSFRLPTNRAAFFDGMKHGTPIAFGYFVVSFALGVVARNAGLTAFQGGLASFLCTASAGEYAGFSTIAVDAGYWTIIFATIVANVRYILTSCALGQKASSNLSIAHRCLVAFGMTDEIFGISIVRCGALNPWFNYGAMTVSIPFWTLGTSLGVIAGNVLSTRFVSALSVTLFGMFIMIVIPQARKNRVLAGLIASCFLLSYIASVLPGVSKLSEGLRTVILTLLVTSVAALLFPIKEDTCSCGAHDDSSTSAAADDGVVDELGGVDSSSLGKEPLS